MHFSKPLTFHHCFLSLSHGVLTLLTYESGVGCQAGLVIVLVGTGARCVRGHSAVHGVVDQPGPAYRVQHKQRRGR